MKQEVPLSLLPDDIFQEHQIVYDVSGMQLAHTDHICQ